MPGASRLIYRFGEYELDSGERRLLYSGAVLALRPKPFEILLHLTRRHGHLVLKTELLEEIWHGRVVSEGALTRCIKEVRRALGDDARRPRFIETRPGVGYTFIAEVVEAERPAAPTSVAVLPIVDLSDGRGLGAFTDGLTEELIAALTGVPGLHVAASTSCFAVKGVCADIRDIGRRLGVGTLVEGSVRRSGDHLRINVQLADAASGYHLWSETLERDMADTLELQREIGHLVARRISQASDALQRTGGG